MAHLRRHSVGRRARIVAQAQRAHQGPDGTSTPAGIVARPPMRRRWSHDDSGGQHATGPKVLPNGVTESARLTLRPT